MLLIINSKKVPVAVACPDSGNCAKCRPGSMGDILNGLSSLSRCGIDDTICFARGPAEKVLAKYRRGE